MRAIRDKVLVFLLTCLTGCAQLEARKVSVDDRLTGQDCNVKGFRYYVSRPYLVVTAPIVVSEHTQRARVVRVTNEGHIEYGLLGFEYAEGGVQPVLRTLDGQPAPATWILEPIAVSKREKAKRSGIERVAHSEPAPAIGAALPAQEDSEPSRPAAPASGTSAINLSGTTTHSITVGGTKDPLKIEFTAKTEKPQGGTGNGEKSGEMKVVYLPDFEEQIAVQDRNFLSKSTYALNFQDGWQLLSADGTHNATDVAVKVLETIKTAISAASSVEKEKLDKLPVTPPVAPTPQKPGQGLTDKANDIFVEITVRQVIPPGVYRLNKSTESVYSEHVGAAGILGDLGLPVQPERHVKRLDTP